MPHQENRVITKCLFEPTQIKSFPPRDRLCFRIYGPEAAAFDGSWKSSDLERV